MAGTTGFGLRGLAGATPDKRAASSALCVALAAAFAASSSPAAAGSRGDRLGGLPALDVLGVPSFLKPKGCSGVGPYGSSGFPEGHKLPVPPIGATAPPA